MFGFDAVLEDPGLANGVRTVRLRGGLREHLRFVHLVDPAIRRKCSRRGHRGEERRRPSCGRASRPSASTCRCSTSRPAPGDFIANGVISHNCFARRTHEWLEFDSGRDFDSQIVVKTNLVEVLRRELARPSWKREHVALGTNTDPYQRAEGRYRLMPGVIGALADSGTPFSILTKGTLLRRDIPLLAEAAQRGPGRPRASPWRSGTTTCTPASSRACRRRGRGSTWSGRSPTPACRAASSSRPCCPGSPTTTAHLDAALGAIAAAGATGVTVIPLHLRPGAREWFMAWLAPRAPGAGAALRAALRPAGLRARPSTAPGWPQRVAPLLRQARPGPAVRGSGPRRDGADRHRRPGRRGGRASRRAACRPAACPASARGESSPAGPGRRRDARRAAVPALSRRSAGQAGRPATARAERAPRPPAPRRARTPAARRPPARAGGRSRRTARGRRPPAPRPLPPGGRRGRPQVLGRPDGVLGERHLQRLVGQPAADPRVQPRAAAQRRQHPRAVGERREARRGPPPRRARRSARRAPPTRRRRCATSSRRAVACTWSRRSERNCRPAPASPAPARTRPPRAGARGPRCGPG